VLLALQLNNLLEEAADLVEVPDVVGDAQAAGTLELETALFVVAVATAYSDSVALGLIISQSPAGGAFASEGSTVTITVSLGPDPTPEPIGGHYWPSPADQKRKRKDYRSEQDERRLQEQRELREAVERAALIEKAEDVLTEAQEKAAIEPPSTVPRTKRLRVFRRQVASLEQEFAAIKADLAQPNEQALHAVEERLNALIAKAADELVSQVAEALIELIQELSEDE
jgi:hypothetical protein